MAYVTLNTVYSELQQVKRELEEVKYALIPVEEISDAEHRELDAILKEMKAGKERNWREAFRK